MEMWEERMRKKFPFLLPANIKDGKGRRPTDPEYDARTLHLPHDFFKASKVQTTHAGQRSQIQLV